MTGTTDPQRDQADGAAGLVEATPSQVLTGLLVGFSDRSVVCTVCHAARHEGEVVTVCACRRAGESAWTVTRCYCPECALDIVPCPTLGVTEVLGTATLGMRSFPGEGSQWLCLNAVEVVAVSSPTAGVEA